MTLSVLGAGFGRTGTLSLKHALERLGFGPCYHMFEVRKNPRHDQLWLDALEGRTVDWDGLFRGYRSACDWPQCHYWRELARHFPEAKVILTVREPDRWYESIRSTIFPHLAADADPADRNAVLHRAMTRKLIQEQVFGGRWQEREHVLDVYRANVEAARRELPPERLLVYEASQGWQPLCAFLGVDVPDEPYPRVNSTEEFQARSAAPR